MADATYKPAPRSTATIRYYEALGTEFKAVAVGKAENRPGFDEVFVEAIDLTINRIPVKFYGYLLVEAETAQVRIREVYVRRNDYKETTKSQMAQAYDVVRDIADDLQRNGSPTFFLAGRQKKIASQIRYKQRDLAREIDEYNALIGELNDLRSMIGDVTELPRAYPTPVWVGGAS